jgi:hypothetical protein
MKKLVVLVLLMICSLTFGQKGAKIEFMAKDNTIDYGKINKDLDTGVRFFEFTNTGDAPLLITNARSSCGCTVPKPPTDPILPGKTGKIEVKYNMNPGTISKTITVESNAVNVENGSVNLFIKGEVFVKVEVSPLTKPKSMMDN